MSVDSEEILHTGDVDLGARVTKDAVTFTVWAPRHADPGWRPFVRGRWNHSLDVWTWMPDEDSDWAANQFGHDIHIRAGDDLAPVGRAVHPAERLRQFLAFHRPAAYGRYLEGEAQFERDLSGIFREHRERARSYVAQANHAHVHRPHLGYHNNWFRALGP